MNKKAKKYHKGKPKLSLISYDSAAGEAKALEYGLNKYGKNNYKLGMEWSLLLDAADRHMKTFSGGVDVDTESKLNHLYLAKANIGILIYMFENKIGNDDR